MNKKIVTALRAIKGRLSFQIRISFMCAELKGSEPTYGPLLALFL